MLFTDFSSGELSKTLFGRADIQQYYHGASLLRNFDIIPTGGVKKRAGFKLLGTLKGDCRLIPFYVNDSISYVLEIGSGYMRFWKTSGTLCMKDASNALEFTTSDASFLPTSMTVIRDMQFAQVYDRIIFVHRSFKPFVLIWNSGSVTSTTDSFSVAQLDFSPSGLSSFVPDINLTDSKGAWDSDKNALKTGYENYDGTTYTEGDIDTDTFQTAGNYPGCIAFFESRLWLASTTNEPQKVWASCAPGLVTEYENGVAVQKYKDRFYKFSPHEVYVTVTQIYKDQDVHLFTASCGYSITTDKTTTDYSGRVLFGVSQELASKIKSGKSVTDYYITGDNIPVGTKVREIRTVTASDTNDPSGTYYNEMKNLSIGTRIIIMDTPSSCKFASNAMSIQLWASMDTPTNDDVAYKIAIDKYTGAADGVYFTPASDRNDVIRWLAAKDSLIIGTESSAFIVPGGVNATALQCRMMSRPSSGSLQATAVGSAVVFTTAGNRSLHEFSSSQGVSEDVNMASLCPEMLSESAACDMDYTNCPYTQIVMTRSDGTLAVLMYDRSSGVQAWRRISHGYGSIRSCCSASDDDGTDIVFSAVLGTDGAYTLQSFDPDCDIHLDSWQKYTASTAASYNSSTAQAYNLTQHTFCTLSALTDTFIASGDEAYVGYPYTAELKSMPVVNGNPNSTKRITGLVFRFLDSWMPKVWNDANGRYEVMTEDTLPYSGVKSVTFPGTWEKDVFFRIEAAAPTPCEILSVEASLG